MILIINDVHIADRPPLGRVEGYVDQIMAKLEECREIAQREACQIALLTGDLFHVKRPAFVSHALIQRLITLFGEWPGRRLAILGNHDMGEAGIQSVHRQPIGVLFRAGVLELLAEDKIVDVGGMRVLLSPAHYSDEAGPEYFAFGGQRPVGEALVVKVAHGMIFPPRQVPPYGGAIGADEIDTTGIDIVAYGHVHDDHGIYRVRDTTFVNVGSLSRVARTAGNLRDVHVAVIRRDGSIDRIRLRAALPAAEVFIDQEVSTGIATEDLRAYARELTSALQGGAELSLEALLAEATDGVEESVKVAVRRYLGEAGL